MESTLVNARIPRAKKEAAAGLLRSLGATTSELINGAYDYLIENGRLPSGRISEARHDEAEFAAFVSESTLQINWDVEAEAPDHKALIRAGKRADYESLA